LRDGVTPGNPDPGKQRPKTKNTPKTHPPNTKQKQGNLTREENRECARKTKGKANAANLSLKLKDDSKKTPISWWLQGCALIRA